MSTVPMTPASMTASKSKEREKIETADQDACAISAMRPVRTEHRISQFANWVTCRAGGTPAFMIAVLVIVIWGLSGPFLGFSDTWQLIINSGTSIITFLMVFLIQRSQNKDSQAIHLKLNELIAAINGASNRLINIEQDDDDQIQLLRDDFKKLAERVGQDPSITDCHSVAEMAQDANASEAIAVP